MTTGAMDRGVLDRLEPHVGWLVAPLVVVMVFFDLRRGIDGSPALVSAYLVGFVLLTLALLPWSLRRLGTLDRRVGWMAGLFTLLMAWALLTASLGETPVVQRRQVTRSVMVLPPVIAVVTMLAALSLSLVLRRMQLWIACWLVLLCSAANWPRAIVVHNSMRISTGMGGAAILHVVVLCCLAVFLGCVLQGWRPRLSAAGAALAVLEVFGIGSRAGIGCLLVFGALLAVWALQRGLGRWVLTVFGALVVLGGVLMATVPWMARLLSLAEPRRQENLHNALAAWSQSGHSMLLGLGSGRLWPWYALDVQQIPAPGSMMIRTRWGMVLNSPHSTWLAVLVELGIVGAVVLLAFVALLLAQLRHLWSGSDPLRLVVAVAMVASLAAWVFDTYLLKNFGVSFWWWLVLFAVVGRAGAAGDERLRGPGRTVRLEQPSDR